MFESKERDYIKERSLLKGQLAQAKARESRLTSSNSNLKLLVVVLLFLLPISHCWFSKEQPAQISEKSSNLIIDFQKQELQTAQKFIEEYKNYLNIPQPDTIITYITREGDYPESISQKIYGTKRFAFLIMKKNKLKNSRRMPIGDTLQLWEKEYFKKTYGQSVIRD